MANSPPSNGVSRFLVAEAQGPRDEQQDAGIYLSSYDRGTALLVVSDGVGGNSGGRIASQQVASTAQQFWEEQKGELLDPRKDLQTLCRVAHERINAEGAKRGISPRATIVALYLTPTNAYWIHSGDSRLYHFRAGKLVTRTKDHSILEIMVKQGLVKEEEMGTHPDQGVLIQSLGGEDYKSPSLDCVEITPEDAFVLCTDGFWERTTIEEMVRVLFGGKMQATLLLNQAVERAVKRNGPHGDNVTAAVALPAADKNQVAAVARNFSRSSPSRRGSLLFSSVFLFLAAVVLVVFFNFDWLLATGGRIFNPVKLGPSVTPDNLSTPDRGPNQAEPPAKDDKQYIELLKSIRQIPFDDGNESPGS
jgi:PPM family protein phosphatase